MNYIPYSVDTIVADYAIARSLSPEKLESIRLAGLRLGELLDPTGAICFARCDPASHRTNHTIPILIFIRPGTIQVGVEGICESDEIGD